LDLLNKILTHSSDGYITIDYEGIIKTYNDKARSIFGIATGNAKGHPSGSLCEGDYVVIADNSMGYDDGNLTKEDLSLFGVGENLSFGDGFILMGQFGSFKAELIGGRGNLDMKANFSEKAISAKIDSLRRQIIISVGETRFSIDYIYSFGHMVILTEDGEIKFHQDHGYTARGESVREILKGKDFLEKGHNKSLSVEGRSIGSIHSKKIAEDMIEIARGEKADLLKASFTVNGKPVICDIYQVKGGACMRIEDVSEYESLILAKEKILSQLRESGHKHPSEVIDFHGKSRGIVQVRNLAYKASNSHSNVVVLGESGTGKTLLARQIHENGSTYRNAFIEVNCSAIPENLFESEFFGYEKGAFTGASQQGKKGYFELADGGTLFLDEVAELSISGQTKLLNVIQNRRFYRVGGVAEIKVDFRLIVATNQDLLEAVKAGRFREDLYYRLNVFPIRIPSLKERKEDIPELIEKTIPEIRKKALRKHFNLSPEAVVLLTSYGWPGNVRELENTLERVANLVEHDTVIVQDLDFIKVSDFKGLDMKKWVQDLEKSMINEALKLSKGDKKKAMSLLNIRKSAFYEKLKKYQIE
jgi:transcriptional regulator with PAS, ATPase and Fis domain